MKKYSIHLSPKQCTELYAIMDRGKHLAKTIKRAAILLRSSEGHTDEEIALIVSTTIRTVQRIREKFCEGGIEKALYDAPRSGAPQRLNNAQEAYLVATACSDPPPGYAHWTIELLRKKLISDNKVPSVSVGTIHARLTERKIKPWLEKNVVYSQSNSGVR
jgi:transposase